MFFEGSEKKATITIDNTRLSLLKDFDDDFWHLLVEQCQAKVLSKISNQDCTAYLLSESSLFVWHDRFVILTCGTTSLVNAIEFFVSQVESNIIIGLIFQRKNEFFAHAQPSCFNDDAKILQKYFDGQACRFGSLNSHHNYLYHLNKPLASTHINPSYELLSYQISRKASAILCQPKLTTDLVRKFLRLDQFLPNFSYDDFVFEPYGYSLNAIAGQNYLTIHITPQEHSSYVSIETNLNLMPLLPLLLEILAPSSFDLIAFNAPEFSALTAYYIPAPYLSHQVVASTLSCNEHVDFASFIKPTQQAIAPNSLKI
ncbi:MAG: adenosylmethionine decarboxylase [Gammaproteobacteria bacterium]|nr:adenosylmethionine decarboxylase [Gammaproteobacteria bacterium]